MQNVQTGELKFVPLSLIRETAETAVLRTVDETNEKFQGLMASVRKNGILQPIAIREVRNPANPDQPLYGLVDGRNRFKAAQNVGLEMIPAYIRPVADADMLEAQILANVHKIDTKPMEYTEALLEILRGNPFMTLKEMAARLSKTEQWLKERLQLVNITDEKVAALINEGTIGLVNAYCLAKLPEAEQANYIDSAMSMPPAEFTPKVHKLIAEFKKAKAEGRAPKTDEYHPAPYLQKVPEITKELETLEKVSALLMLENITDPHQAAKMALKWVLHLDQISVTADAAEWQANRDATKARAEERKKEREALKKEEEAKKQADILSLR